MAMMPACHAVGFIMRVETDDEVLLARPCIICGKLDYIESALACNMCLNVAHVDCLGLTAVPPGFWYCPACCDHIEKGEV